MAQLPLTQARDLLHEKQPGEVCHPQVEGDQHSSICSPFIFFTNWHDLSERGKSTMALETMKNNRYRIVRPLGSGSTGEVYLVEDTLRDRQEVVLKLLHAYARPLTHDAQSASRAFLFEAGATTLGGSLGPACLQGFNTEVTEVVRSPQSINSGGPWLVFAPEL